MDDQTENAWLEWDALGQLGTGIVAVPSQDPERRGQAQVLDFVDMGYRAFRFRAELLGATSMKWIPHALASYADLRLSACGEICTDSCVSKGCICDRTIGRCQKAE